MFSTIDKVKEITGMDSNTVYTIVASIVLGFIVPTLSKMFKRDEDNRWKLQVKVENDLFFAYVMAFSLLEVVLSCYICFKIHKFFLGFLENNWSFALALGLFIISTYVLWKIHYKTFFIKKRLIGNGIFSRVLCFIPVFLINLVMWIFYLDIINVWINTAIGNFFIITEMIGLLCFMGRYITYKYSYANIYLADGTMIKGMDIDKIKIKGKWIIIENTQNETRIKLIELQRIEYYGEQKVKLVDNLGEVALKRIKRLYMRSNKR